MPADLGGRVGRADLTPLWLRRNLLTAQRAEGPEAPPTRAHLSGRPEPDEESGPDRGVTEAGRHDGGARVAPLRPEQRTPAGSLKRRSVREAYRRRNRFDSGWDSGEINSEPDETHRLTKSEISSAEARPFLENSTACQKPAHERFAPSYRVSAAHRSRCVVVPG